MKQCVILESDFFLCYYMYKYVHVSLRTNTQTVRMDITKEAR